MSRWEQLTSQAARASVKAFGSSMQYEYCDGQIINICAVPDSNHIEVGLSGEVGIDSYQPVFMIEKCTLKRKPIQGDKIHYKGDVYEVRLDEEDGFASYRVTMWRLKRGTS